VAAKKRPVPNVNQDQQGPSDFSDGIGMASRVRRRQLHWLSGALDIGWGN
jgi:hypothetical protein